MLVQDNSLGFVKKFEAMKKLEGEHGSHAIWIGENEKSKSEIWKLSRGARNCPVGGEVSVRKNILMPKDKHL